MSEPLKAYAQQKLSKLAKHVGDTAHLELELAVERNPAISQNQIAEATIWTKGPVLRARETSSDMRASIDQLVDKLERQVERYREKRRGRRGAGAGPSDGAIPADALPVDAEPRIVKSKQFAVKPMSPEEAVLQLELVGHDFFVFRNESSGKTEVVYRRRDGGYGHIQPE